MRGWYAHGGGMDDVTKERLIMRTLNTLIQLWLMLTKVIDRLVKN